MVNSVCRLLGKDFRLMYQDEAGFGRINKPKCCWCGNGIRPIVPCLHVREYVYAYGAVAPVDGELFTLILPNANTVCMNIFLKELSKHYPDDYILLVVDNASWHKSKDLKIPENIEIYPLPPYTPELNPIEQIWDHIREKGFKNQMFKTLNAVIDNLCDTILSTDKNTIKSITHRNWIDTQNLI